jgi:hypothetical protein
MKPSKTLRELHRIREQITKEQRGLSTREQVARTRREADALLKRYGITLKQVLPPSEAGVAKKAQ